MVSLTKLKLVCHTYNTKPATSNIEPFFTLWHFNLAMHHQECDWYCDDGQRLLMLDDVDSTFWRSYLELQNWSWIWRWCSAICASQQYWMVVLVVPQLVVSLTNLNLKKVLCLMCWPAILNHFSHFDIFYLKMHHQDCFPLSDWYGDDGQRLLYAGWCRDQKSVNSFDIHPFLS